MNRIFTRYYWVCTAFCVVGAWVVTSAITMQIGAY